MPLNSTEMNDELARRWFDGMVSRRWSRAFALLPGLVVRETGVPGENQTLTFRPLGHDVTGTLFYRGTRCVCGWWNDEGTAIQPEPKDMYPVLGLELVA